MATSNPELVQPDSAARPWRFGTAVLVILAGLLVISPTASAQTAFTGEERQGLQIGADSIRHAGLGFALPNPGPTFVRFPLIEQQMAAEFGGQLPPDLIYWGMRDSTGGPILLIQVTGTPGLNESTFRDVLTGTKKGASRANARIVSEEVTWNDTRRETRITIQHPNGLYVAMRCVPSLRPGREFVVCTQIFSQKPDDLIAPPAIAALVARHDELAGDVPYQLRPQIGHDRLIRHRPILLSRPRIWRALARGSGPGLR